MAGAMAASVPELIEVRSDERFDEARLAAYLRDVLEGADRLLRVRQFAGGHANLTYLLRYGEGDDAIEYVLRRPPLGPVAASSHDMHREYRALSRLWRSFPLAPRAYHYCQDASVIGADFLIMERRHGLVVRGGVPEAFGGGRDREANRKLSCVVVDTLADFHAIDPEAAGLADLGRDPAGFLRRQVTGWSQRYERARTAHVPVAEEVSRWLLEHLPPTPRVTLVHNDWRLDNMAVDPADPGRCVAVYDWDMCSVGDPLCDVGTVLAMWSEPGESPAGTNPMPTQLPGFMSREEAGKRYAERSGRDLAEIAYYNVFGTFKMGVVLQQIYFRFHAGQTQDQRFASMGAAAESLFQLAWERARG
jgi:aminoglycoside phosphotransferase (APT) family kinase protein